MIRAAAARLFGDDELRRRAEAAEKLAAGWQGMCLHLSERNVRLMQALAAQAGSGGGKPNYDKKHDQRRVW